MKKIALVFLLFAVAFLAIKKEVFAADPEPIIETIEVYQTRNGQKCNFFKGCVEANTDVSVHLSGISYSDGEVLPDGSWVGVRLEGNNGCDSFPPGFAGLFKFRVDTTDDGSYDVVIPGSGSLWDGIENGCTYQVVAKVYKGDSEEANKTIISQSAIVSTQCEANQCNTDLGRTARYDLCSQIDTKAPEYESCVDCFTSNGIWTAVGCIPSNPEDVIKVIITIGLALGGGVVLVMILAGSFMLSVSQGDPNKTKEAKEIITSAIIGLLFVIFSVTILQFIGVNILHIPGFGE